MFFFTSLKERKKRERMYFKKIYPLGKEQREWELRAIDNFFAERKNKELFLFELIRLKENIYNKTHNIDEEDDFISQDIELIIKEWKENIRDEKILEQADKLIKLALLQKDIVSLDKLPGIESL